MTALLLTGCDAGGTMAKPTEPQPRVAVLGKLDRSHAGTAAPTVPFFAGAARGKALTVADFRGRRVLVNLWATWCAPCVKEMPALNALAATAGAKLAVLPVSQDMEGWRAVDRFFRPGRFPALTPHLDSKMAWGQAIGAAGLPVTILYDERGREVWRVAGDFDWGSDDARRMTLG